MPRHVSLLALLALVACERKAPPPPPAKPAVDTAKPSPEKVRKVMTCGRTIRASINATSDRLLACVANATPKVAPGRHRLSAKWRPEGDGTVASATTPDPGLAKCASKILNSLDYPDCVPAMVNYHMATLEVPTTGAATIVNWGQKIALADYAGACASGLTHVCDYGRRHCAAKSPALFAVEGCAAKFEVPEPKAAAAPQTKP